MAVGKVQELSNPMPHYVGLAPGLNSTGSVPNFAWTPRIVAKTAAYTVKPEESGTFFTTLGATTAITFTLPAVSDGPWYFRFYSAADVTMTVAAAVAGTMLAFNDLTADAIAFSTASEKIGGAVEVFCDGTWVYASLLLGDGRYQTATITSA